MKMHSHHTSIQQLVSLLQAHQIKYAVLCSGSRNAAIIQTMASQETFHCIAAVDERSAAFMAMGMSLMRQEPVAVCCTSGSAVANLLPAVSEAFYREVPLLLISADRPAAEIGQNLGQTMPQLNLLHSVTTLTVNLPEVHTQTDACHCNRLINDALLRLRRQPCGPVHINIPIAEPLFHYTQGNIPTARKIDDLDLQTVPNLAMLKEKWQMWNRKMILIGQCNPTAEEEKLMAEVAHRSDCVVLADHFSNFSANHADHSFERTLHTITEEEIEEYMPDLLITLGGHVVSKKLAQQLRTYPPKAHWNVTQQAHSIDSYQCLSLNIKTSVFHFLDLLQQITEQSDPSYAQRWRQKRTLSTAVPPMPAWNNRLLHDLTAILPAHAVLHVGNSSLARQLQYFPIPKTVKCYANRGLNGIDGSLSTAIGAANVCTHEHIVILGDLSFFYDMNALWNATVPANLTIIMVNNGGGAIFEHIPEMQKGEIFETFILHKHRTHAKAWAEETGFDYQMVQDKNQWTAQLEWLKQPHLHPRFLEIITNE